VCDDRRRDDADYLEERCGRHAPQGALTDPI
jgi:hypothetical protein